MLFTVCRLMKWMGLNGFEITKDRKRDIWTIWEWYTQSLDIQNQWLEWLAESDAWITFQRLSYVTNERLQKYNDFFTHIHDRPKAQLPMDQKKGFLDDWGIESTVWFCFNEINERVKIDQKNWIQQKSIVPSTIVLSPFYTPHVNTNLVGLVVVME